MKLRKIVYKNNRCYMEIRLFVDSMLKRQLIQFCLNGLSQKQRNYSFTAFTIVFHKQTTRPKRIVQVEKVTHCT